MEQPPINYIRYAHKRITIKQTVYHLKKSRMDNDMDRDRTKQYNEYLNLKHLDEVLWFKYYSRLV